MTVQANSIVGRQQKATVLDVKRWLGLDSMADCFSFVAALRGQAENPIYVWLYSK